ncbi:1-aminocyclopropane-1-carboxylate oxidase [Corchorus olitorius]|uniref:1-aminocyclopropane-1-carboxylate oxidase n=1 Tax=Corchorus olitorius TaxID=93759 RepID=A0A1R3JTY6_9ROSI|nr:1-aminocyclopropane-1-carboxylate oxidase [Corchorus olitorius]
MAIDKSKAGIKGLVDAGLAKLPRVFVHDHLKLELKSGPRAANFEIPVIELGGANENFKDCTRRADIINQISEIYLTEMGKFLPVVNHGIPVTTLKETIN